MALARILPRFDSEPDHATPLTAILLAKAGKQGRAEALARAEESGFRKGMAAGRADLDVRIAEERAAFAEQLRRERVRWIEEEAGPISAGWDKTLRALQAKLSDAVAILLVPLIEKGLASKAVDELSAIIGDVLSQDRQPPLIRVEGPEDLIGALRARLGHAAARIEFASGAGAADIRLVLGDSVIETQLQPWKQRLSQACAGTPND
jgi:hypothetical protein